MRVSLLALYAYIQNGTAKQHPPDLTGGKLYKVCPHQVMTMCILLPGCKPFIIIVLLVTVVSAKLLFHRRGYQSAITGNCLLLLFFLITVCVHIVVFFLISPVLWYCYITHLVAVFTVSVLFSFSDLFLYELFSSAAINDRPLSSLKVVCGSKCIVRGESARDHVDLLVSSRYWPPVYAVDMAKQVAVSTDVWYPELAAQMWGKNQGCFSDPMELPEVSMGQDLKMIYL